MRCLLTITKYDLSDVPAVQTVEAEGFVEFEDQAAKDAFELHVNKVFEDHSDGNDEYCTLTLIDLDELQTFSPPKEWFDSFRKNHHGMNGEFNGDAYSASN